MRLVLAPPSSRSSSLLALSSSSSFDSLPLRGAAPTNILSRMQSAPVPTQRGAMHSLSVFLVVYTFIYTCVCVCVELVLCAPVTHPSFAATVFALALASSNAFCGPGNAARYCVASRDALLNSFRTRRVPNVTRIGSFSIHFFPLPSSIRESLLITRFEFFFSICICVYGCSVGK